MQRILRKLRRVRSFRGSRDRKIFHEIFHVLKKTSGVYATGADHPQCHCFISDLTIKFSSFQAKMAKSIPYLRQVGRGLGWSMQLALITYNAIVFATTYSAQFQTWPLNFPPFKPKWQNLQNIRRDLRPKCSKSIPVFRPKRLKNHPYIGEFFPDPENKCPSFPNSTEVLLHTVGRSVGHIPCEQSRFRSYRPYNPRIYIKAISLTLVLVHFTRICREPTKTFCVRFRLFDVLRRASRFARGRRRALLISCDWS